MKKKINKAVAKAKAKGARKEKRMEKKAAKKAAKAEVKRQEGNLDKIGKNIAKAAKHAAKAPLSVKAKAKAKATKKDNAKIVAGKDADAALCQTVRKQKHCEMPKYSKFCPASCKGAAKLKDSRGVDSMSSLEQELSASISKADAAIAHAHSTMSKASISLKPARKAEEEE